MVGSVLEFGTFRRISCARKFLFYFFSILISFCVTVYSYVDTCKYDSNDVNISCKHVKSSLEQCSLKAEPLHIDLNMLANLRLSEHTIQMLRTLYTTMDSTIPLVQRILPTVFVVRCELNGNFPTGLLHVLCTDDNNETRHLCACKRAKQTTLIDQTKFMENDICVHVLLVFLAIWNNRNRLNEYKEMLTSIQFLFKCVDDSIVIDNVSSIHIILYVCNSILFFSSKNIHSQINNINGPDVYGSLAITANEIIDNLDSIEMIQVPSDLTATTCDTAISFNALDCECIPVIDESSESVDNALEFVNYKVEMVMNPVDVNEEILPNVIKGDYIDMENIYDVADINSWTFDGHEYSQIGQSDVFVDELLGSGGSVAQNSVVAMKSYDGKAVAGMRSDNLLDNDIGYDEMFLNLSADELRLFTNWLDSVIEKINQTMDFNDDGQPDPIIFSVPHVSEVNLM